LKRLLRASNSATVPKEIAKSVSDMSIGASIGLLSYLLHFRFIAAEDRRVRFWGVVSVVFFFGMFLDGLVFVYLASH
jgi:hypothetical protein